MIALPYGRVPYPLDAGRTATALEHLPIPTMRREPRHSVLAALARHVPRTRGTIAVARGAQSPSPLRVLVLLDLARDPRLLHHDDAAAADLIELGVTSGRIPTRVHCRLVVETDAVSMLVAKMFLLADASEPDGATPAVVAGDLAPALHAATDLARAWFHVRARRVPRVIAADATSATAARFSGGQQRRRRFLPPLRRRHALARDPPARPPRAHRAHRGTNPPPRQALGERARAPALSASFPRAGQPLCDSRP